MNIKLKLYWAVDIKKDEFVDNIIIELSKLLQNVSILDQHSFWCVVYWSLTTQDYGELSDIDVMFISKNHPQSNTFQYTKNQIKRISSSLGLRIDEEVPYENKLFYSDKEINDALYAKWLPRINWHLLVPRITSTQQLLEHTTKLRLGTNILTTPNIGIFLNDSSLWEFDQIKSLAPLTLQALWKEICTNDNPTYEDIYTSLIWSNWTYGRDHLWYKTNRVQVDEYIHNQLRKIFLEQDIDDTRKKLWFNS